MTPYPIVGLELNLPQIRPLGAPLDLPEIFSEPATEFRYLIRKNRPDYPMPTLPDDTEAPTETPKPATAKAAIMPPWWALLLCVLIPVVIVMYKWKKVGKSAGYAVLALVVAPVILMMLVTALYQNMGKP